jgi:hypothetical protein
VEGEEDFRFAGLCGSVPKLFGTSIDCANGPYFTPRSGFVVAQAQPEGFFEFPVCRLGEVADPAGAAEFRAGKRGHQSSIPSNIAADPWPSSGWQRKQ